MELGSVGCCRKYKGVVICFLQARTIACDSMSPMKDSKEMKEWKEFGNVLFRCEANLWQQEISQSFGNNRIVLVCI